jgi:hypothetical protein
LFAGGVPNCRPINLPERLCNLPWEKRYGLPSANFAKTYITNTAFGHFNTNDCGRQSYAIMPNPSQPEYTPPMFFSGITWINMDVNATAYLGLVPQSAAECLFTCDALLQLVMYDVDGTLFGSRGGAMLSQENPALAVESACSPFQANGAIRCDSTATYRPVSFENVDMDRSSRRLGPLQAERKDGALL